MEILIGRNRGLHAVLFVAWLGGGPLAAQQVSAAIPANLFTRPTGLYGIGTDDWLWIDDRRPESYTKDPADKRRLPIQVWYPADSVEGRVPAPYIRRPAEFGAGSPFKSVEHVTTNSVVGAPLASAQRTYPVLVYSPGAGSARFGATFLTELLASHGYVVFSIDHPGLNRSVLYSDGTPFQPDSLDQPHPAPNQDMRATLTRSMDYLNTVAFPIWLEDSRFVLDRIEALNRAPGPFRGRLDLDRIGMLGWSFGGAAAIELLRTDPRVKAAVNQDGRLFGGVMTEPVGPRPFMLFHHGIDDLVRVPENNRQVMREMLALVQGYDSTARARALGDWYDITIARTNHGHFADVALYYKAFEDTTLLAGRRGHEIISAYTLAFFDRFLKGMESPLLAQPSSRFPEVTFRRK
jgi:predicted dienelactone hydrolase